MFFNVFIIGYKTCFKCFFLNFHIYVFATMAVAEVLANDK